jgi:hypothetical protein
LISFGYLANMIFFGYLANMQGNYEILILFILFILFL